ncbi:MAG: hypothetical protein HFE93_05060 [Acutalibacter muris]|jgi:hypothetical protein|nr:hypothetical protein [Acutalibacter muris]
MKPILFNTEMVRAILDDRKTVTRRVVKKSTVDKFVLSQDGRLLGNFNADCPEWGTYPTIDDAPYCPGDILYVRETWCQPAAHTFWYKADSPVQNVLWRPSIHMPREAARIFLRVTDVRVERLQDISPSQCVAEGADDGTAFREIGGEFVRGMFNDLWNSTIKPADCAIYGWDANPWVWVIEFERISREEAEHEQNKN